MFSKQFVTFLYLGLSSFFILLNAYDTSIFELYPNGYNGFKLLEVTPTTSQHVQELRNFALNSKFFEFWKGVSIGHAIPILTPPDKVEELITFLNKIDLEANVTLDNIQDAIDKENEPSNRRTSSTSSFWQKYQNLSAIYDYLDKLEQNYDFVSTENIGKTYEGRDMKIAKVCKGVCGYKKAVWIDGGLHAREWISHATVTWLLKELVENDHSHSYLTERLDWYILPVHNPDGYEYSRETDRLWRKTRSNSGLECPGVDANRNYDFHWGEGSSVSENKCSAIYIGQEPFSEIETRNVRDFILKKKGDWIFYDSIHSYSQMILLPWAYTKDIKPGDFDRLKELSDIGAKAIFRTHGEIYQVGSVPDLLSVPDLVYTCGGISLDWAYGVMEIPYATTLELRPKPGHGLAGFKLPTDQIIPTGEETWAFHEAVIWELLQEEISIIDGKQLSTIPSWGPSFKVKFSINVNSFDNGLGPAKPYSDVLHFTSTDQTCCNFGDRLPGVFLHRDNRVIIGMNVDIGKGTTYYTSPKLEENKWYNYEIMQKEGVFTVHLDGNLHFQHVNTDPMSFENVRVFSVFPGSVPANAKLKN